MCVWVLRHAHTGKSCWIGVIRMQYWTCWRAINNAVTCLISLLDCLAPFTAAYAVCGLNSVVSKSERDKRCSAVCASAFVVNMWFKHRLSLKIDARWCGGEKRCLCVRSGVKRREVFVSSVRDELKQRKCCDVALSVRSFPHKRHRANSPQTSRVWYDVALKDDFALLQFFLSSLSGFGHHLLIVVTFVLRGSLLRWGNAVASVERKSSGAFLRAWWFLTWIHAFAQLSISFCSDMHTRTLTLHFLPSVQVRGAAVWNTN